MCIQWVLVSASVLGLCLSGACEPTGEHPVKGYTTSLPAETPAEREARHARIAERKTHPIVIVHRGASSFAPENTLEAYTAAMDYGADGCEVDPRRTADGVIILFHDDMLENLTNGFGSVSQHTYYELLQLKRRSVYGTATADTGIPTLASLLALARQRAMLLHFDLKEPGLADEVARLLDEADMWDAVVGLNIQNAGALLQNPKLKLLSYKAPGLYLDRSDVDPEAVKSALDKPGEMIIVDDPRAAAKVLGRAPYQPVPLPKNLCADWPPKHGSAPDPSQGANPKSVDDLSKLLNCGEYERVNTSGNEQRQQERARNIVARGWAAERLAETGSKTPEMVRLLEYNVRHRSLHKDWMYHGVDGACAVRVLASLSVTESVPVLVDVLMNTDTRLTRVVNPKYPNSPISFLDWRIKTAIIHALGELQCDESKQALTEYLKLDAEAVRKLCFPMYPDAVKSLMKQALTIDEVRDLLRHSNSEIRGTAILFCLDNPSPERTEALKVVPWAAGLPGAR